MKIIQITIFCFLFLSFSFNARSQQPKEDEIVVIKGEKYVIHQVRTGETIYSLSRNFQVDSLTLVQKNPKISNGLKIGDVIQIPYRDNLKNRQQPVFQKGDPSYFDEHILSSRKETPYFIARKYGITVEELYAYNPGYSSLNKGDKLRIPRWEPKVAKVSEVSEEVIPENSHVETTKKEGFLVHTVLQGETLFSIAQKYGISDSEILFYNPEAKNLKAGSPIYLPVSNVDLPATSVVSKNTEVGNSFEHIIESGETLWGISRKYGVSEEQLKAINPGLEAGFPAGVVIKIPVKGVELQQASPVNEEAFVKHTVQKSETLYGIAAQYNLTIPDLKKYNPSLENRNLVDGETVLIPKNQKKNILAEETTPDEPLPVTDYYKVKLPKIIPEACRPINPAQVVNETFTVALFLPLFTQINDTINKQILLPEEEDSIDLNVLEPDTTIIQQAQTEDMFKGFYGNSENFLQFYEGVLLAVDSLTKTGMNIRLNVFDTEDNPLTIRKFLRDESFLQTDLIIGPVSQKVQKEVAPVAAKNRIPMVSPLMAQSDAMGSNPYIYQVNPDRSYIIQKTAEMVAEEYFNSNIIVLRTGNYEGTVDGRLVNLIQEKLNNSGALTRSNGGRFSIYNFKNEGSSGLTRVLSKEKENVILIPSSVEGELSVAISNINNLAGEYSITLIAPTRYQQQYKSIEIEKFHNLKMQFLSPFWTEYGDMETIRIIEKFRKNYFIEPNSFGMQGYDVAFYFLSALKNYGRSFEDCLPYLNVHLLQGNYYFDKVSAFGGYMNKGVSVISYERDYDVVRKRVVGLPGQSK